MYDNIEAFYTINHDQLFSDDSSLRPGKSFTKDVENCINKFRAYYISNNVDTFSGTDLPQIIGDVDTNTRHQNLRVMREFGFLDMVSDGEFCFTSNFIKFVSSEMDAGNYILKRFYKLSTLHDFTMYFNLLLCTLREAYIHGQVILFSDSTEKFNAAVPSSEERLEYKKRIFEIYGYHGRNQEITDEYTPNISYMSRAELENLGLLVNKKNKIGGFNTLELTPSGHYLLSSLDKNLGNSASNEEDYVDFRKDMLASEVVLPVYNTELNAKNNERNRIIFGAPGTGKSFALKKDTEEFLNGTRGTMERVTFHPDYTYSQFVGTYKPISEAGTIKYEFVPGPFMRVFVDAIKSGMTETPQPHVLVIEEINRAKVASVFGDVFQLLDRDDDGVSEYDIQTSEDIRKYLAKELGGNPSNYARIRIPNNMFIWATMNSADQGVFPMDTAFKRRWNFEYLGINKNEGEIRGKVMLGTDVVQEDVSWNALRRAINEKLAKDYKVNEDKLMGPFFLSKKVIKTISDTDDTIQDTDRFIDTFKSKVIMYLYEDAAKQHKHKLFSGCDDTTKYSAVCDSFDRIGMQIFGEDFEEKYYKPQEV